MRTSLFLLSPQSNFLVKEKMFPVYLSQKMEEDSSVLINFECDPCHDRLDHARGSNVRRLLFRGEMEFGEGADQPVELLQGFIKGVR